MAKILKLKKILQQTVVINYYEGKCGLCGEVITDKAEHSIDRIRECPDCMTKYRMVSE